jgi:hypothetical protein
MTNGTVKYAYGPEIRRLQNWEKLNGMFLSARLSIATSFAYTQNEILDIIIPDLESLRNSILLVLVTLNAKGQRKYTPSF